MESIAQTNIQLYNQLRHQGRPAEELAHPTHGVSSRRYNALYSVGFTVGEVAESAEGSRLLSGYRGKTSVPGSNPGLSARCALSSVG